MVRYLLGRAAAAVFVLWAAFTLSFGMLYLLPGNPVDIKVGGLEQAAADPAQVEKLRAQLGLDGPWWQQYGQALWRALHGDFGTSIQTGAPVTKMILDALPSTLSITSAGLALALVLGSGIALTATYTRWRPIRRMLLSVPALTISFPPFWVGLMLIHLVAFQWRALPSIGNRGFSSIVLPAITIALPTSALIAQVLAKSLRSAMAAPYIDTARAKGAGQARLVFRHALRNAALPPMAVAGLIVGSLLVEAVTVETVFSRAGVGRLTATAVANQDTPVVLGVVVYSALLFVSINLLVDLLSLMIDPRVRRREEELSG